MSIPSTTLDQVKQTLSKINDENIVGFSQLRARKMGPQIHVDLQLQVNPWISVSHGHQLAENVRHEIMHSVHGVTEVIVCSSRA